MTDKEYEEFSEWFDSLSNEEQQEYYDDLNASQEVDTIKEGIYD